MTVLKPSWSRVPTLPSHFMCGSMDRTIAIFSGTSGQLLASLFDGEQITAVPTVVGSHPSLPDRYYGATASGKVSYFGRLDGDSTEQDEDEKMGEAESSEDREVDVKPSPRKRAKR